MQKIWYIVINVIQIKVFRYLMLNILLYKSNDKFSAMGKYIVYTSGRMRHFSFMLHLSCFVLCHFQILYMPSTTCSLTWYSLDSMLVESKSPVFQCNFSKWNWFVEFVASTWLSRLFPLANVWFNKTKQQFAAEILKNCFFTDRHVLAIRLSLSLTFILWNVRRNDVIHREIKVYGFYEAHGDKCLFEYVILWQI